MVSKIKKILQKVKRQRHTDPDIRFKSGGIFDTVKTYRNVSSLEGEGNHLTIEKLRQMPESFRYGLSPYKSIEEQYKSHREELDKCFREASGINPTLLGKRPDTVIGIPPHILLHTRYGSLYINSDEEVYDHNIHIGDRQWCCADMTQDGIINNIGTWHFKTFGTDGFANVRISPTSFQTLRRSLEPGPSVIF